jgi:cytochrome b561
MEYRTMRWRNDSQRYGAISKLLHWTIVALIITQFVLASAFEDMPSGVEKLATVSQHKSVGMLILILAMLRIAWRVANPAPAMPSAMPAWQRKSAAVSHGLLYLLLLLQPITGWLTSSTKNYPVSFFGWFQFPDLVGPNEGLHELLEDVHEALATTILVVALLHAAAALYHHFVVKDDVLRRMLPGMSDR